MKIPFDIKYRPQIESGEYKVETKNGCQVEILKFGIKGPDFHIAGIIHGIYFDGVASWTNNGMFYPETFRKESPNDLMLITPEPELTESEDENLKNKSGYYKAGKFWKASTLWNATKDKIPQRVSNRYILQECTWNIGTLQQFANEVKNIQEVSLDYPIILDMNGKILDGAHRVVKAYLEGEDIDVVYLGDNEWPEPDYDEEKTVKAFNTFEECAKKIRKELDGYRYITPVQLRIVIDIIDNVDNARKKYLGGK